MDSILEKYRAQWIQLVEPTPFVYSEESLGNRFSESTEHELIERKDFTLKNIAKLTILTLVKNLPVRYICIKSLASLASFIHIHTLEIVWKDQLYLKL